MRGAGRGHWSTGAGPGRLRGGARCRGGLRRSSGRRRTGPSTAEPGRRSSARRRRAPIAGLRASEPANALEAEDGRAASATAPEGDGEAAERPLEQRSGTGSRRSSHADEARPARGAGASWRRRRGRPRSRPGRRRERARATRSPRRASARRSSAAAARTKDAGDRHRDDEDQPVRLDGVAVRRLGAAQAADRVGEGAVVPVRRVERLVGDGGQDDADCRWRRAARRRGLPPGPGPAPPAPVPRSSSCGPRSRSPRASSGSVPRLRR